MNRTSRMLCSRWSVAAGAGALFGLAVYPPAAHAVQLTCGQTVTTSVVLTADLLNCPGDGLVVGASGITIDLNGHSIDGVGLGTGIRNSGFDHTTVTNGGTTARVEQFDHGLQFGPGASGNIVEKLTVYNNEFTGVELDNADDNNRIRNNVIERQAKRGISVIGGSSGNVFADNELTGNQGEGFVVVQSGGNRLENNRISGSGDGGLILEGAVGNTLLGNTIGNSSDGAIVLRLGSNDNLVQGNSSTLNQDAGMTVSDSTGNRILSNTLHDNGDSGLVLQSSHGNTVTGNDVSRNTGGIDLSRADNNLIESNIADHTTGDGISVAHSLNNTLRLNRAGHNGSRGIHIEGEAAPGTGNLLILNTTDANRGGGIAAPKSVHTLTDNTARDNAGWGIYAGQGNADGGGNRASGNAEPNQCTGVVCAP
jgi:parallel beta-helix repeat protein